MFRIIVQSYVQSYVKVMPYNFFFLSVSEPYVVRPGNLIQTVGFFLQEKSELFGFAQPAAFEEENEVY